MGLLDSQNQEEYYTGSDFGNYQFVTLDSIINAFMFTYVGESKLLNKVHRTDVQFHAMRAIQELQEQTDGSNTWANYQTQNVDTNIITATDGTDVEVDHRGRRYGLDPQHTHEHGSFFIDPLKNYIHFSSNLSGKTIILKYISDGLGTDAEMVVHKFCEEAVYKSIAYGLLSVRTNMPEMVVLRFKKEKFAETRKAKIRLSNIKIEEFTQVLKGMSKQIK